MKTEATTDWTPTRRALALAHIIVKTWETWSDENAHIADDAMCIALDQVGMIDLHQVDGTLSAPLNVFRRAYCFDDNPEDLTYAEMVGSIEISIGLDAS